MDKIQEKVNLINDRKSPIKYAEIDDYLAKRRLNLFATTDDSVAYHDADFVIIATPTNYDPEKKYFDTSSVEQVNANELAIYPDAVMVIKSTVPCGYSKLVKEKFQTDNIMFSPECLREG